ncbi:MAG: hypothetical protein AB7V04_10965 [Desulfomonilaceae bacterium]
MGFFSRSTSMMRYKTKGEINVSFWEAVDSGIKSGSFREIDSPGELIGVGWTSIEDFSEYEFTGASYLYGNYVALSLRVDTVRIPPRILEIHLKKETRKLLKETGQRRLSSNQRKELKETVKEVLKKQVLPSIQVFDFVWDTSKSIVYFTSLSIKARERFEDHFKKSFGLSLIPLIPYLKGDEVLASPTDKSTLEKLKASDFTPRQNSQHEF